VACLTDDTSALLADLHHILVIGRIQLFSSFSSPAMVYSGCCLFRICAQFGTGIVRRGILAEVAAACSRCDRLAFPHDYVRHISELLKRTVADACDYQYVRKAFRCFTVPEDYALGRPE
jgi:hypothetical protein